jgi:hypothetical protein
MAAYVRSALFDQPTVFLDSDAFLLRPIHTLFSNYFDIGLTHRSIGGQMPVNEGVIYANNRRLAAVSAVFDSYLSSYLSLEKNKALSGIYSNLRRWRGGQLSINSLGQGGQRYHTGITERSGAKILILPCSVYNLSQISEDEVRGSLSTRCAILHLKGLRKSWLETLKKSL